MQGHYPILPLPCSEFPELLKEIPDPPKTLFIRGKLPETEKRFLCVVGSRKYSPYGERVCAELLAGLSGYGVCIVSGLALGIDGIAHTTALSNALPTIVVPGSGLDDSVLYPRSHIALAHKILDAGGALISESLPTETATTWSFPKRNRIMAGLCHATLVVEAHERSGTLITARLALEYDREVLAVPGSILSPNHTGSNTLIKDGARVVTCAEDILDALQIPCREIGTKELPCLTPEENRVLDCVGEARSIDDIADVLRISIASVHVLISTLEIKGYVIARYGKIERVR